MHLYLSLQSMILATLAYFVMQLNIYIMNGITNLQVSSPMAVSVGAPEPLMLCGMI